MLSQNNYILLWMSYSFVTLVIVTKQTLKLMKPLNIATNFIIRIFIVSSPFQITHLGDRNIPNYSLTQ